MALTASFSVMLAVYCTTAAVGYWYFGDSASPLVTADLAHNSWYTSHARLVPVHRLLVRLLGCLSSVLLGAGWPASLLCLPALACLIVPHIGSATVHGILAFSYMLFACLGVNGCRLALC